MTLHFTEWRQWKLSDIIFRFKSGKHHNNVNKSISFHAVHIPQSNTSNKPFPRPASCPWPLGHVASSRSSTTYWKTLAYLIHWKLSYLLHVPSSNWRHLASLKSVTGLNSHMMGLPAYHLPMSPFRAESASSSSMNWDKKHLHYMSGISHALVRPFPLIHTML